MPNKMWEKILVSRSTEKQCINRGKKLQTSDESTDGLEMGTHWVVYSHYSGMFGQLSSPRPLQYRIDASGLNIYTRCD